MSVTAAGVRLRWDELPAEVRHRVEQIVGDGPIVSATSQPGGFSPGTADRLLTEGGRRAFVKAASPAQNPDTPGIHRTEAMIVGALPRSPHLPELIGLYEDGEWVAAVYVDIEGRSPNLPWGQPDIDATATALRAVSDTCTPNPVPGLRPLTAAFASQYGGWARLRETPAAVLDPWVTDHLELLCDLADHGLASLAGDTLVHGDTRADNLIVRGDGRMVVIDWPWACVGAAWFDLLCLAINVDLHGGDPDPLVARFLADLPADDLTGGLAGLCGDSFFDAARNPPPPGLPTVRGFQAAQGRSTLRWLRRRLGD